MGLGCKEKIKEEIVDFFLYFIDRVACFHYNSLYGVKALQLKSLKEKMRQFMP